MTAFYNDYLDNDGQPMPYRQQNYGQTATPWDQFDSYENYSPPTLAPVQTGLKTGSDMAQKVNPALSIGLKGLSAAASYFGGAQARGIRKQGINGLRGMLGRPVYDPNQAFSFARRGTYNDAQQMGGQYDRNFGLDTGRGAGMYGKAIVDRLASQSSGLYVDSEKAKADRDARIYQLLASYQG